jgi:dienelactone hydrolase
MLCGEGEHSMPGAAADISDFTRTVRTIDGKAKTVLSIGNRGPAIIVMQEVFGFTPNIARFCRWLAAAGFQVHAPILFGRPDASNKEDISLGRVLGLCVSREFNLFASGKASPVTVWLRGLARELHAECGGPGVGAIGMCLTGGFALAMAVDPVVLAPVLSQPSLPVRNHAGLDIADADLAVVRQRVADGLKVQGYRFAGDTLSRQPRFDRLAAELGDGFDPTVLPDACGNPAGMRSRGKPPHSVFTVDLVDAEGEPTRAALDKLIGFFQGRLAA